VLSERLEKAINHQINNELVASYTYLAMAAYLDQLHYTGFAAFMQRQSDEERSHAHRLYRYVLDRDGTVHLDAIASPRSEYDSVQQVFDVSLQQERENTKSIYELYEIAREEKDYITIAHLQWFLDEQVEEEKIMGEVVGRLKLAGANEAAILVLDEQVGRGPGSE
jgi:ferritin